MARPAVAREHPRMTYESHAKDVPPEQRADQTDDPGLPDGPPAGEPADPANPVRPTGVGVIAGILFLLVFVALVIGALLVALQNLG
jgi:hypothetical protein